MGKRSLGWKWHSDIFERQADVKIDKKDFKLFHVCFSSFLSNYYYYYYYLLWLVFGKMQKKYFITHRKVIAKMCLRVCFLDNRSLNTFFCQKFVMLRCRLTKRCRNEIKNLSFTYINWKNTFLSNMSSTLVHEKLF